MEMAYGLRTHEIEDHATPLAILGAGILGAGCFYRHSFMSWDTLLILVDSRSHDGTNCPSGVTGLCTPGVFESSTETVTETTETDATGTQLPLQPQQQRLQKQL